MPLFQRRLASTRSAFLRRSLPSLEILEDRTLLAAGLTQLNLVSPDPLNPNVDTFGSSVVALRNGNVVVTDPTDSTVAPDAGAVFLYNGQTGALLGKLTGSSSGDFVGSGGVTALTNGNFVVSSPDWHNGGVAVGAATWVSGGGGPEEAVSSANSLVGSTSGDEVAAAGVTALSNGNYVVDSPFWQLGGAQVGAVTWGNGWAGTTGPISAGNSLVGSTNFDEVGIGGVTALTSGNYVVSSPSWQNPNGSGGAATWANGNGRTVGPVSATNSLVGGFSYSGDVGGQVTALSDGDYVVGSPGWNSGAADADLGVGAATWGNGRKGIVGAVSARNSLVGSTAFDNVGTSVTALANGNYVVASPGWHTASGTVGAVTWGDRNGRTVGVVSAANSLVGSTDGDDVGSGGVTALTNGNYVVASPSWQNGGADVGAVTWGDGCSGMVGSVTLANSLVGATGGDMVGFGDGNLGSGVTALSNGNYVVDSPFWQSGGAVVGAVTWARGDRSSGGKIVSAGNSLIGSTNGDQVGSGGVTALTNGNYVVSSPLWQNGAAVVGAVTLGHGCRGTVGTVNTGNSLVGSTNGDDVGSGGVIALDNGNYVVSSPGWQSAGKQVAAVTWGDGRTGKTIDGAGTVDATNSLIGTGGLLQQVVGIPGGNAFLASFSGNGGSVIDVQVHDCKGREHRHKKALIPWAAGDHR
jgi:Repeat of unknown function (DUF5650)